MATKGKDIAAFRAQFDKSFIIPQKIKAALADLGASWETELEFMKRAGICTTDLARFRDGFSDHYIDVRGAGRSNSKRVWAGTKAYADQLRGTLS